MSPNTTKVTIASRIGDVVKKHTKKALSLLDETPIEIGLAGAIFASIGGYLSYSHESMRGLVRPLGFSEISQLEKDAKHSGKQLDTFSRLYALGSDLEMKIFEAFDTATGTDGNEYTLSFAHNLQHILDPSNRDHKYNLADVFKEVPIQATIANDTFSPFVDFRARIASIPSNIRSSWTERHRDEYHTEIYTDTETSTDSKGNTTSRLVVKTREVYDYTDHNYWYHDQPAQVAIATAKNVVESTEALPKLAPLTRTKKTNPEGREAAKQSRERLGEDTSKFNDRTYLQIANTWATGSQYNIHFNTLAAALAKTLHLIHNSCLTHQKQQTIIMCEHIPIATLVHRNIGHLTQSQTQLIERSQPSTTLTCLFKF